MSKSGQIGVLVMSYGTPESMEGIEAYYTHMGRGHPPTSGAACRVERQIRSRRWRRFPACENTNRQVAGLQAVLDTASQAVMFAIKG